ncbi:MAG: DUF6446 family protein [Pseudomonadota bacterium]
MSGRLVSLAILLSALVAGAALYYLQVYGFYRDASAQLTEVRLVAQDASASRVISADDIAAIDADSSPIRFRACFSTGTTPETLAQTFVRLEDVDPRNAPRWFDCFDAEAIAAELDAGTAQTFLGEKNVEFGVDRIVAVTQDGRGYIWHELNDCGEKAYDGTIVGEECPKREAK